MGMKEAWKNRRDREGRRVESDDKSEKKVD